MKVKKLVLWALLYGVYSVCIAANTAVNSLSQESANPDKQSCIANGLDYDNIVKTEKNIQQAVKTNNINAMANMMQYPLTVNYNTKKDGSYSIWIYNKADFIKKYKNVFSDQINKDVLSITDFSSQFCSWRGALFGQYIWLEGSSKTGQVYAINYVGDNPLPLQPSNIGVPITSVSTLYKLQVFIDLLKKSKIDYKNIQAVKSGGTYSLMSGDQQPFELYILDNYINNQAEYIVTSSGGSMDNSWVDRIFLVKNNKLVEVNFESATTQSFKLGPDDNWYLSLSDSFITKKNGKYFMNFQSDGICTYLWQNNKLSLESGGSNCFANK